jgi:hypothetical protein
MAYMSFLALVVTTVPSFLKMTNTGTAVIVYIYFKSITRSSLKGILSQGIVLIY